MRMRTAIVSATLLTLLAIGPAQAADEATRARRALDRLGFGPAPGELQQATAEGAERWIARQLAANQPEPAALRQRLAALPSLQAGLATLMAAHQQDSKQERKRAAKDALAEAVEARLASAVESPNQLREALVSVWFDHFNVFSGKGPLRAWVGAYEREAIRPHVLGRFRDMLGATAHHPAMLFYLDNWRNGARGKDGRPGAVNENYARELLELHTLGVDGGYAQADVVALAHLLTGWTYPKQAKPRKRPPQAAYAFAFNPRFHDDAPQTLLGVRVPSGGVAQGEQALDLLARHPATARHVARRLARAFVADDPPPALVTRLAERFTATDGDLRAVTRALVESPEFWAAAPRFKTPYRQVVSALRAGDRHAYGWAARALRQAGQPVYGCVTPDGYNPRGAAWLSPTAMTQRIAWAAAIAGGKLPAEQDDEPRPRPLDPNVLAATLGDRFGPRTQAALAAARPAVKPAVLLGAPECLEE